MIFRIDAEFLIILYVQYSHSKNPSSSLYRCPSASSVIRCDTGTSAASPRFERKWRLLGFQILSVVLVGLDIGSALLLHSRQFRGNSCSIRAVHGKTVETVLPIEVLTRAEIDTYVWKTTVCALADLRLVDIDENPGMSQWPSTPITFNDTLACPSYRLLVDQANGCFGFWLCRVSRCIPSKVRQCSMKKQLFDGIAQCLPYLKFQDGLLEPRSRHRLSSWVLTPRPTSSSVRRLHDLARLSSLNALLKSCICLGTLGWDLAGLG
jgi:hypothetical protein